MYNAHNCEFTSIGEIWSYGMLTKVRYQSRIFVGILGGNRQEMLGGNNFHPASSRYPMHWKLTYSSTSKAGVPLHTYLLVFLNIYFHQNSNLQPYSSVINGRVEFHAQGTWPCWILGGIPPSITVRGWLLRQDAVAGFVANGSATFIGSCGPIG